MMSAETQITSKRSLTLDLPPSCLEFSPTSPSHFLVGTYNLQVQKPEEAGSQKRDGSIVVYELVEDDIVLLDTVRRPAAVLDLRFQTCRGKEDIVGTVSSTGALDVFRFKPTPSNSQDPLLTHLSTIRIFGDEEGVLFLQFAWHPSATDIVAISTSAGDVHILKLSPEYGDYREHYNRVITHTAEVWSVAISPVVSEKSTGDHDDSHPFTLYTGADDSILQYASLEVGSKSLMGANELDDDEVTAVHTEKQVRGHNAGVTAILPLPCGNDIVVTGSYDDHIRVFSIPSLGDIHGLRKSKLLAEHNLDGGVWRLRLVRHESGGQAGGGGWRALVLASCMHAGCRVVEIRGPEDGNGEVEVKLLGRFEEHKSMNYASDFKPGSEVGGDAELVCLSSSFYDKLLCLWSIKLDNW